MPIISLKCNKKKKKDPAQFVNLSENLYYISHIMADYMYLHMAFVSVNLYITQDTD